MGRRKISEGDGDHLHGTESGYRAECRGLCCRMAHAETTRQQIARRSGTLAPDDPRHGKVATYTNYKCRCPRCTDAVMDYHRQAMRTNSAMRDARDMRMRLRRSALAKTRP